MVQCSNEHSTACLGNKHRRLPVIWKCIWIPTKCAGLWTHMVCLNCCNHLWVLRLDWTTCMKMNEKILICLQAIKIHSDVTPSYALTLMRSDRRGLWWICNEFKPLPAYTKMVVSLWFSFEDFSQVFPMRVLQGLYWMVHNDDEFCPSIFPWGVSGFIFQCAIQEGSILCIGIPYWLEGSVWWYCWWVSSASDEGNA
jgi:hypothetical protein